MGGRHRKTLGKKLGGREATVLFYVRDRLRYMGGRSQLCPQKSTSFQTMRHIEPRVDDFVHTVQVRHPQSAIHSCGILDYRACHGVAVCFPFGRGKREVPRGSPPADDSRPMKHAILVSEAGSSPIGYGSCTYHQNIGEWTMSISRCACSLRSDSGSTSQRMACPTTCVHKHFLVVQRRKSVESEIKFV